MARKQRPEPDAGTWMNTYSDLVTLLLCFFVLLYSMTAIDADKWQRFANAFKNAGHDVNQIVFQPGDGDDLAMPDGEEPLSGKQDPDEIDIDALFPVNFDQLYEYLKNYTEEHNMQDSVEIVKGENTVYIRFNNNIFFYGDKSDLKPESFPILDFLGDCLHSVEDQIYLININGHTASVDIDDYPVNSWTLSGERATNIAIFMEERKEIAPTKLRPIGYGNNYPVSPNDTEENRMMNRRVDMVIISNDSDIAQAEGIYEAFAGLFDPGIFPKPGGVNDLLIPDLTTSE